MRKAVTVGALALVASLAVSAVAVGSGVHGTNGRDSLRGTNHADRISAKAGLRNASCSPHSSAEEGTSSRLTIVSLVYLERRRGRVGSWFAARGSFGVLRLAGLG